MKIFAVGKGNPSGKKGKQAAYPDAPGYLCRIKRIFNLLKY
jgi:hypothetical protein